MHYVGDQEEVLLCRFYLPSKICIDGEVKFNGYLSRLVDKRLDFYLSTFGAVCVEGPKWCGKTWTCTMHAKSEFLVGSPAGNFANRQLARLDVNRALKGEAPHLIDEWQEVPAIWDAVRASEDERAEAGRYKEVWAGARAAAEVIAEGNLASSEFGNLRKAMRGLSNV